MKINQDYPVLSSRYNRQPKEKDYLLYEGGEVSTATTWPPRWPRISPG